MADTSEKFRRRILDACLLMESDLAYPHSTKTLAEYAGISQYYFRHSFKKVVGESAIAHLTRLRMARAAIVLKNSDVPITQIGLEIGYSANSSFTHAFQRIYGCSPKQYREQQGLKPYMVMNRGERLDVDREALAACPLSVQIRKEPTRRVALMRHVGSTNTLPMVWPKMLKWCQEEKMLNENPTLIGIHHDDWDASDPGGFNGYRYDAAVVIEPSIAVSDAVNATYVPGGEVAVVQFNGSIGKMDTTWKTFWTQWLPASGYQPRLGYVYDIYDSNLMTGSKLGVVLKTLTGIQAELCIPIVEKPIAISKPD